MPASTRKIGLYSTDTSTQDTMRELLNPDLSLTIYDDVAAALTAQPQLLIIDLVHSGTDGGYSLCKQLRRKQAWSGIALFAITRDTKRSIELALTVGFDECLFLPMNKMLFNHRMKRALQNMRLRRNAMRYRSLVENTQDAVIVVSPDESIFIEEWNEVAERLYGWSAEEVIGKGLRDVVPATYLGGSSRQAAIEIMRENYFWEDEVLQSHKNGNHLRVHTAIAAVVDEDRIIEYICVNRDVTAAYEAKEALKQSEERLSSILAAIPELVLVLDGEGRHRWIATEDHPDLLLPANQLINYKLHELLDKKQADDFLACIRQVLDTGERSELEYALDIKGALRWFRATVLRLDADRVVWVAYDITGQKQAQRELQDSASSYEHLFEAANDAIFLIDVETGEIIEANRQASRLLGYNYDELIGMPIEQIEVATDGNQNDTLTTSLGYTNHLIFEQRYRRKNGRIITVESSSRITRHKQRMSILSFARDITARKHAEAAEREQRILAEALRDTAAAFNSTLEQDDVLDLILAYVDRVVTSQASEIMLIDDGGYAKLRRYRGYIHPEMTMEELRNLQYKATTTSNMQWMIRHQQPLYIPDVQNYEGWQPHPATLWIRSIVSAPIIIKGEVTGFINLLSSQPGTFESSQIEQLQAFANQAAIAIHNAALFESTQQFAIEKEREVMERTSALEKANQSLKEQIIERQQVEEELEDERNLLRTLIDNLPDHVYVKDQKSRFLLANRAVLQWLGLQSLDELIGKTDIDLNLIQTPRAFYEEEQTLILSGQALLNVELERTNPSGETRWLMTSKLPLRDINGQIVGLVGIDRNITEIKRAEESLQNERNLLRTLIDTIPDLIYIKDRERRFLLANRAMLEVMDASSIEDVAGLTDFDVYPEAWAARQLQLEQQLLETEQPLVNRNDEFTDAQGKQHAYLISKFPLRDTDNRITGLIGVHRDITELRQAEEQLTQVLDSARCLLWYAIVEENADTFDWNLHIANEEAASQFLQLPIEKDYTTAWLNSIVPEDAAKRETLLQTHLKFNRSDYSLEMRCQQADGMIRWLVEDVQIRQLTPGRWSLVGVCTDITDRKTAEAELQRANDHLEARVVVRTRELLQANESLQQEINERRRAEDAERQQRILAEALRDSSIAINRHMDIEPVLDAILDTLKRVVPHDAAAITLLEDDILRVVRQKGHPAQVIEFEASISELPNLERIRQSGQSELIDDVSRRPDWHILPGMEWIRSNMAVPVALDDEIIGFLHLNSRLPGQFTRQDAASLAGFASQVSIAIRNERLMDEIRQHAADLEARVLARTADLTQKSAELEAILNAMRDGVVYYNLESMPQYTNRAMSEITLYSNEEWLSGQAETEMLQVSSVDADGNETISLRKQILDPRGKRLLERQGFWKTDIVLKRKETDTFDAGITFAEARDDEGNRIGMVMVLRDISESRQLEAQKKQFIARASHELRTPITNIKTRLYLLKRQPDRFDEHVRVATSVANWMQSLVETMFDISRFEQGIIILQYEEFVLQELIEDVYNDHHPRATAAGLTMTRQIPEAPIYYEADRSRLRQVLTNLVGNALHHTSQPGEIRIELEASGSDIYIRVMDTGEGIPDDMQAHLFEPFYRGREDNKGAGLGLSIAHDIVVKHGGDLSVESTLHEGSTFTIRLPVLQASVIE